jgi:hypothetical protein
VALQVLVELRAMGPLKRQRLALGFALIVCLVLLGRWVTSPDNEAVNAPPDADKPASVASPNARVQLPSLAEVTSDVAPREAGRNDPTHPTEQQLRAYDFKLLTRPQGNGDIPNETNIRSIFESEPTDQNWAPQVSSLLSLKIASMPERSAVGDVNIECHTTLCRVRVGGVQDQLQSIPGGNGNIQSALIALATQPKNEDFDDASAYYTYDESVDAVEFSLYLHRRGGAKTD